MAKQIQKRSNKQNILVLGGAGFIGRHAVKYLKKFGANVIVGTRNPTSFNRTESCALDSQTGNCRQVILQNLKVTKDLDHLFDDIDIVVNTVGILRERWKESYEQVHHQAVKVIAEGCAQRNIRIVHVSALELNNPLKSGFAISKVRGEKALRDSGADWVLVRPSLVDGEGGFGASWFRSISKWPVQFIPTNMQGMFSPIDANDLGEAIARIALKVNLGKMEEERVFELGGMDDYNFAEYLKLLRPKDLGAARYINVYPLLARVLSHICDVLHVTPFSFGHYELLELGSAPVFNRLENILGRSPRRVQSEMRRKTFGLNDSVVINKRGSV